MQTGRKCLALLLALVMVISLLPATVFAADGCLAAKDGAVTAYTTTQGGLLNITLSDLFTDSSSHTLTYSLDSGDYGTQTKIANGVLAFTNPTAGTYTPTVTATCSDGATASVKLSITVKEADDGDHAQYNYDETPADCVTVYVTISSDGVPITGRDGTVLSHLEVKVPYFDLANQDLSDYYRYGTESGSGEYSTETVVNRPTALHLYLYMIGVYYLGYTSEEIMTGTKKIVGASGEGNGVLNMDGEIAYKDTNLALNITGSATSMYMQQFWGHDENLMYYRNHMYPLMSAGWGSTADYILLSDGDTIDVAMFTDWTFYSDGGAFTCFDADDYSVNAGETVTFKTLKYDTSSVADGGTEQFDPVTGMNVAVYDSNWNQLTTINPTAEDSNSYSYTFTKGGTYYLMARDTRSGENARYAPATAKVTVAETPVAVPTRKADYPAESSATVQTGKAYLLSDLQAGKVFDAAEGQSALSYTNIYYERSADNGATWSGKTAFTGALFGGTTIQITENTAGTYIYRFYASHDGEHFSVDTWTLTLTVEDEPMLNFSFYVGKDYSGNYPIIKLYNVTTDEEGNEIIGDEVENCFVYSNFTTTAPDGVDAYDTSKGILTDSYQMFYANLTAGRYAYRAFGKNTETEAYDVELGGMTITLPTDTNVDGNKGGGTSIYLCTVSYYTNTKKTDGTYFTADEYHIRLDCPIMSTTAAMGTPYTKGNYAYYPTVVYAAGNACLYNIYAYPDIDGYMFTQNINQTFRTGYTAQSKSLSIGTAITLTVNVPQTADFGLYFQWNNFNTTEVEPNGEWTANTDGTKTNTYTISMSNSNYTWRMSDSTHTTQAGWLASMKESGEKTFTYGENAATNRVSHSFASLGTATTTRDEADLQVNLDPSGYKTFSGTARVRAYRYWELINSDTANIMFEPDFHWTVKTGDASLSTVDGGNASANWADVTAGTQDSVITVYYDSIDANPGTYMSHGGLYPATQPHRVGVMVVGGTGVTHGTADAHVVFNMAEGATTTRSAEWDYNFDTWYYEKSETDPALTFTVTSTGTATVEYAFVTATDAMQTSVTGYSSVTAGENGSYSVQLRSLKNLGNGLGGTVIIRMTDDTGVSYRLVRVAQVTITAENVSNPGENIMPGNSVKLTFDGMFRTMNKMSGIFNPTNFKVSYDDAENDETYTGSLNQYQVLDNASITFTVPEDIEFAEDAQTTTFILTNGYTFGTMYSAANPFGQIYTMTDTGVGTNFNAVSVTCYLSHYADAVITVYRKVIFDTALVIPDASGTALEGVTVVLTGPDNVTVAADANGRYQLGYGRYSYILTKDGYGAVSGEFTLGSANEADVKDGILTLTLNAMSPVGVNAWDGTTMTEPSKDESDVYQISTAAELAWFANAVNTGSTTVSARLTANIELASKSWTPIGTSAKRYTGTFDGDGHIVKNLYINTTAGYQALFGYVGEKATIKNLGVTGIVITTGQYASGIVAYLQNYSVIDSCFTDVTVTSAKTAAGIADGQSSYSTVQNCYNLGTITATASGGMAGGIASASGTGYIPTIVNCYNIGKVYASKNSGSLKATAKETTNCYYLEGSCPNETSKPGTVCTAEELKTKAAALGESFVTDLEGVNGGYPILRWQSTAELPRGDANRDGVVDMLDAQLVYAYATAGGTLSEAQLLMADMDSDGHVDVKDAAMIYAIIAAAVME